MLASEIETKDNHDHSMDDVGTEEEMYVILRSVACALCVVVTVCVCMCVCVCVQV